MSAAAVVIERDEEDIRREALGAFLTKACGARVEALGVGSWVARPGERGQRSDETIMCASSFARHKAMWMLVAKGMLLLGVRDLQPEPGERAFANGVFMAWLAYPRASEGEAAARESDAGPTVHAGPR